MKFWPFLFFASTASVLNATVNEPLRLEFFSGYRNDRIHWHLQNPGSDNRLIYRELYRDIQYWENGLTLKVIHRDLSFFLRGAFGGFGRGNLFQRYGTSAFFQENPEFQFSTDGWTADGSGYFGYAVNLTADRTYKVLFTPLVGYGGYFERLERKNGSPNFFEGEANGIPSSMNSSLPSDYRLVWYGFLFGGGFTIEPGGRLVLNAGYSYHLLRVRQHSNYQNQIITGTPATSETANQFGLKVKNGGNKGHSGWAQLDFKLSHFWRMGLGGQIHYFYTPVLAVKENLTASEIFPAPSVTESVFEQKFKLRWTSFSGWIQISREI